MLALLLYSSRTEKRSKFSANFCCPDLSALMSDVFFPGVALLSEVRSIRSGDRIELSLHAVDALPKVAVIHRNSLSLVAARGDSDKKERGLQRRSMIVRPSAAQSPRFQD